MKTPRSSLIPILIILIIAIGIIAYLLMHKNGMTLVNDGSTDDTSTLPEGAWPSDEVRQETIEESGKGYKITADYPVTESASVTNYFRTFAEDQVKQFKEDTAWAKDIENAESDSLMLDVSYTRVKGAIADNYVFQVATYTGGAHGLQATKTFNLSPEGQLLTVSELFSNGAEGLKTIAPLVQKELMTREFAEEDWVKEGTAPVEQNYQNFTIDDTGLTFIFDPYQVAPYASGVQKVTIPLSSFSKIANKEVFGK